jgi:hypothetical protein
MNKRPGRARTRFPHVFFRRRQRCISRVGTGLERAKQFAAGNDVEARSSLCEQFQNGTVRVRFHRVANEMIQRRERGIEPGVMIEHGPGTIYIEWSAELLCGDGKIDIFAEKVAVAVVKRMHEEEW